MVVRVLLGSYGEINCISLDQNYDFFPQKNNNKKTKFNIQSNFTE